MPKVLIKGNGKESFDYLVSCNTCKSVLLCDDLDIKKGTILEVSDVSYNIEMVYCDICKKDIEFRENTIYVLPSGLIKIFPDMEFQNTNSTTQIVQKTTKRKNIDIKSEFPVINIKNPEQIDAIDLITKSAKRMRI